MITRKLLPFQNVVATGKAVLEHEKGPTYHQIVLQLGGTDFTKAMITRIVCKLNGKIFYDLTGTQLDTINKYRGIADDANHLTIDFTEPSSVAANVAGMNAGAIPTGAGVNSFITEVDIAGATAPTLESFGLLSEAAALTNDARILAMIPQSNTFASTGKFPIVLPHGPGVDNMIKRVHFFGGSISELEVKKNSLLLFDSVNTAVNEFIQKQNGRAPQAGLWVFDPIVNGDMFRVIQLANAQSIQFSPTVASTGTVTTIAEYYAKLAAL